MLKWDEHTGSGDGGQRVVVHGRASHVRIGQEGKRLAEARVGVQLDEGTRRFEVFNGK